MAVTETPPETVSAASETATSATRPAPTGLAALLGSGDHKVIGRLYLGFGLGMGLGVMLLGALFSIEAADPKPPVDIFSTDTVFQFFTLYRVGTVFLLAFPLVIGLAMVVVPLQVGARSIAFPRAAAASFWTWLLGSGLLIASYAMNGGPGGGSDTGVNLWISAMGVLTLAVLTAGLCLATTVIALRSPGLTISRTPFYAWSVAVAAVMWLVTLPVLFALVVVMYVDHRLGTGLSYGSNAGLYARIAWLFRNPEIYVVAIPVLGFVADVLHTTARTRHATRAVVLGGIGAFGVASFGAYLATTNPLVVETKFSTALALVAVLPIFAVIAGSADLFRKGGFRFSAGLVYAVCAVLTLLLGVGAGALGSIPSLEVNGTIYDIGVSHAIVLAAVIASLGGIHWWATKVCGGLAAEGPGILAALLLLLGSALVVIPDLASGLAGDKTEVVADWSGGIQGLNVVIVGGVAVLLLGVALALVGVLAALKAADEVPADPWDGLTLEWLTPSPPPLENFPDDLAVVTSGEPLVDLREES